MKESILYYEKKYIRHSEYHDNVEVCANDYVHDGRVITLVNGIDVKDRIIKSCGVEKEINYKLPFQLSSDFINPKINSNQSEFHFWDIISNKPSLSKVISTIYEGLPFISNYNCHLKLFENVQLLELTRGKHTTMQVRNNSMLNVTVQKGDRYIGKNIYLNSFDHETFSCQLVEVNKHFNSLEAYFNSKHYKLNLKKSNILISRNAFEILHESLGHFFENLAVNKKLRNKLEKVNFNFDLVDTPNSNPNSKVESIDDVGTICKDNFLIKEGKLQEGYNVNSGNLFRSDYTNPLLLRMNNLFVKKISETDIVSPEIISDFIQIDELRSSYYDSKRNRVFVFIEISQLYKNGCFIHFLEPFGLSFQPEEVITKMVIASEVLNTHATLCLKKGQAKFTNLVSPIILIPDLKLIL